MLFLNCDIIQQFISVTRPLKLKSLFLEGVLLFKVELFQILLQKSGCYLEDIEFGSSICNRTTKQQLLELTKKYCTNIRFFNLFGFNNQHINSVFDIIENIEQSLNYLTIDIATTRYLVQKHAEISSIVLLNLGQILPSKLEYLSLILSKISTCDLEVFLKNSQNTFIKKLIIRNNLFGKCQNVLPYIKEYIMKKKRVKYLAIKEVRLGLFLEFSTLNDEMKEEFKLYDIKVQDDIDLHMDCLDFIKELY